MNGELHLALDSSDFLFAFPLKGEGRARIGFFAVDVVARILDVSFG
jgi:hypothetical protein